jgi:hypothetical protein
MKQWVANEEFKPLDPVDLTHAWVWLGNSFVSEWLVNSESYPLISKKGGFGDLSGWGSTVGKTGYGSVETKWVVGLVLLVATLGAVLAQESHAAMISRKL